MFELGYYLWFDSDSTYFPIHFCAPFLDVGISRGMPHGRLPLSVTNHSLLLGRLPQAITSWSMPHGRMPLAITSQSMPHGRLLLSVSKKPEYAAWTLATFLVSNRTYVPKFRSFQTFISLNCFNLEKMLCSWLAFIKQFFKSFNDPKSLYTPCPYVPYYFYIHNLFFARLSSKKKLYSVWFILVCLKWSEW